MAQLEMPDRWGRFNLQQVRPLHRQQVDAALWVDLAAPVDSVPDLVVDAEPRRRDLLQFLVRPDLRLAGRILSIWSGVSAAPCCSTRLVPQSS
jgi:hypothetical protein